MCIRDSAWNHHERGNRRNVQREVLFAHVDELEIDAGDLNVELRLLQFWRQLHGAGDLLIENGGLGEFLFEFGLGNDFGGLLERRRDYRKSDRNGFPVEHEANLELDGAEIRVIND